MSFCFICLFKQQLRVVAQITSHKGTLGSITLKTAGCHCFMSQGHLNANHLLID